MSRTSGSEGGGGPEQALPTPIRRPDDLLFRAQRNREAL
jgi:hypothetical protein